MSSEKDLPHQPSCSLFPAYSTAVHKDEKGSDVSQEWLSNSSYTCQAFQSFNNLQKTEDDFDESLKLNQIEKPILNDKSEVKKSIKKNVIEHFSQSIFEGDRSVDSFTIQNHLNKLTFIEEAGLSTEKAFRFDSKYDCENIAFGGFDRKVIAKYHVKYDIPMGLSRLENFHFLKLFKRNKQKINRYYSKAALKQLAAEVNNINILIANKAEIMKPNLEYLPLSTSVSRAHKVEEINNFGVVSKSWKSNYLEPLLDSYDTSETSYPLLPLIKQELDKKYIYFNNAISQNPYDEKLWLDFVNFQKELFSSFSCYKSNYISEKSRVEKQIAILDKALKFNPNSVKLTVTKLKLCRNLWDMNEVTSHWENLIFHYPHNVLVWQEYLQFVISDITYFATQRIIKLYSKCIKTLSNLLEENIKSHSAPSGLLEDILGILMQYCVVLQCCGFKEKALGTFQAVVEFNLFTPDFLHSNMSSSEWITFFEPFWDTGSPRIGEKNALGWSKTVSEKKILKNLEASILSLEAMEDEILKQKFDHWKMWLEFEKLRMSNHWLPWRPNVELNQTASDLDDTDRIVSFDDISAFLFRLRDERLKFRLLCNYLTFLGVDLHFTECSYFLQNLKEAQQFYFENFEPLDQLLKEIFYNKDLPNPLNLEIYVESENNSTFINNVFELALNQFCPEYRILIINIWIKHKIKQAFKSKNKDLPKKSLEEVKKFVKNILKKSENRNCLMLWADYLYLEFLSTNKEKAFEIFTTLLVSSTISLSADDAGYKNLWFFVQTYIQLFHGIKKYKDLEYVTYSGNCNEILHVLSYIGSKEKYVPLSNSEPLKPPLLVRAQKGFKTAIQDEFLHFKYGEDILCPCIQPFQPLLNCLFCAAYLSYFSQGLTVAMEVYNDALKNIQQNCPDPTSKGRSFIEEQIYVARAELLNFHTWNTTSSLKQLQINLYHSVEKFPNNVRLLYLLVKIKSASFVVGPTRRFFYKLLKSSHQLTPITWLFSIALELAQWQLLQDSCFQNKSSCEDNVTATPAFGFIWKIRSLFDKAVCDPVSRHCIALWRSYLKFEICYGDSTKAKSVFHQALENCPWAKVLLLDGVQYFPEDLSSLVDMMNEKQLRIHTPLEEIELLMQHAI